MERMTMYRIYTEHKNEPETTRTVGILFDGFTRLEGVGYWKGNPEQSLMFEIIAKDTKEIRERVNTVAETLKRHNQQQAVFVTRQPIQTALV